MPRSGIIILDDEISPFLDDKIENGASMVASKMERGARQVEAYAKQNAPWSDITGQARDGLHAEIFQDYEDIGLELSHSVEYGEWLETIQNGRFAIIIPTLEQLGQSVLYDAASALMDGGDSY